MYTNVYIWRHAVDRAPCELDVFLSLTHTQAHKPPTPSKFYNKTWQLFSERLGLSLHAEMDNLKAMFLLLSRDR